MVVLSSTCEIINSNGIVSKEAIHQWIQKKDSLCSRQVREDEFTWEDIVCSECHMNPLIGSRYGCTYRDCHADLCETCLLKTQHSHPLVKYLVPGKSHSLEQMFEIVPHLLKPDNEDKILTKTMWQDDVKAVGFYFSAQWCPPHRAITPKLAEFYKEIQANSSGFRLVFVSCDRDEKAFDEYRSIMPWPAVPFNSGNVLKAYFQLSGKFPF